MPSDASQTEVDAVCDAYGVTSDLNDQATRRQFFDVWNDLYQRAEENRAQPR